MAVIRFTAHLQSHLAGPELRVEGTTVRTALDAVFAQVPVLRSYLLDDQGAVRQHVVMFVDGIAISDRISQSDTLTSDSEIFVMQALSGG